MLFTSGSPVGSVLLSASLAFGRTLPSTCRPASRSGGLSVRLVRYWGEKTAAAKEREPISRKAWLILGGTIAAGFGLGLWSRSSADAWLAGILALPLLILPPITLALRRMDKLEEPQASIWFYAMWFVGIGVQDVEWARLTDG